MLGLEKHAVALVPHDPHWIMLGAEACAAIAHICGPALVDVQHVGSTAVPGLSAKPILDIAGGAQASADIAELRERLVASGYIYRGDTGEEGGHLFVRESAPEVRTIHLHIVDHDGGQWRNYLAFRDTLRREPDVRAAYQELKRSLAQRFAQDREAYTASKKDFIAGILRRPELR